MWTVELLLSHTHRVKLLPGTCLHTNKDHQVMTALSFIIRVRCQVCCILCLFATVMSSLLELQIPKLRLCNSSLP